MISDYKIYADKEIANQAETVLYKIGLDLSTAVNLFLQQVIYKKGVSFDIQVDAENPAYAEKEIPQPGFLKGKIWIADDFDAPMDEYGNFAE
jgi:addiction module RelB/DinJ family antitoxin